MAPPLGHDRREVNVKAWDKRAVKKEQGSRIEVDCLYVNVEVATHPTNTLTDRVYKTEMSIRFYIQLG